jgi:hypothetical protein
MNSQIVLIGSINRASLIRRGRRVEYFTVVYNSLEGLIAVVAGLMAGSIALVGFGFDSLIEVTSGASFALASTFRRRRVSAGTSRGNYAPHCRYLFPSPGCVRQLRLNQVADMARKAPREHSRYHSRNRFGDRHYSFAPKER